MKQKYIIAIMLMFIGASTYAQKLVPNSIVKANKASFRIEEMKQQGTPSNWVSVVNVNNAYHSRSPKIPAWDISLYEKIEKGSLLKAFTQVFSDHRLQQLVAEHTLNISLYVDPYGKILEVDFLLRKNTSVTARELEQLETEIKKDVTFKIRPEETKGADFFVLPITVKYQNVLDRIER